MSLFACRLIEPLHAEGHQALAQLSLAVESMGVALRGKEREVKTLQKSASLDHTCMRGM